MKVIHVLRKPLAARSIGLNVLDHGTGAVNIDAGRVGSGRWPANLVLQHLPGCRKVGTRQIKGSSKNEGFSPITAPKDQAIRLNASVAGINRVGYANEDGTETTDAWDCELGCPVAELDEQSGDLRARGNLGSSKGGGGMYGHGPTTNDFGAGDTGGASRFFKQVGGESDG